MALLQTASHTAPTTALVQPSDLPRHRLRAQVTSLPIERDSRGRSFTFSTSLHSPRTPQLSTSPTVQLLESLRSADPLRSTPRWKNASTPRSLGRSVQEAQAQAQESTVTTPPPEEYVQPDDTAKNVLHLERCLEASPGSKETISSSCPRDIRSISSDAAFGVAYQGSPSARAVTFVYPQSNTISCQQSESVFSALRSRTADRALIPVENTVEGTIHRNYDLLLRHELYIVGEMHCPRPADQQECLSGIDVLPSSGSDGDVVVTRFWILAREPIMPREEECFKTTVALVLADGLGALYKVLGAFTFRDIKVTKVESRPWKHEPLRSVDWREEGVATYFQYVVFIDFEGSLANRRTQNAMVQLQQHSSFMRVLGSYPTIDTSQITSQSTGLRTGSVSPRAKTYDLKAPTDVFAFIPAAGVTKLVGHSSSKETFLRF